MFQTTTFFAARGRWASLRATLVAGSLVAFACFPARGAGAPVPVTLAGQPVETFVDVISPTKNSFGNLLYTVPAGKQLLVQSMTLIGNPLDATIAYTAFVRVANAGGTLVTVASLTAPANTGAIAATTQPMQLHVPAGASVSFNLFRSTTGTIDAFVSLSGLLTDAP